MSKRQIAASVGIGPTAAGDSLRRAEAAGLEWPLPEEIDDAALEARLYPPPEAIAAEQRPLPDWAAIHRELKRPGVTLQLSEAAARRDFGSRHVKKMDTPRPAALQVPGRMRAHVHRAHGTPLSGLHKSKVWLAYAKAMVEHASVRRGGRYLRHRQDDVVPLAHRLLDELRQDVPARLDDIVEVDETFFLESFKGRRKLRLWWIHVWWWTMTIVPQSSEGKSLEALTQRQFGDTRLPVLYRSEVSTMAALPKRIFDLSILVLSAPCTLPTLLAVAVLVWVKLGSPILFRQQRPGRNGKTFELLKFRSMTDEKDQTGQLLPDAARLNSFGRWLRSTSLDELPELFNIARGEMSFVGPRPLLVEYLPLYSARQARRHEIEPGLTGWAQINGRNTLSWDERLELDVWYVENRNLMLDFRILWRTLFKVLKRSDISQVGSATMTRFEGSGSNREGSERTNAPR